MEPRVYLLFAHPNRARSRANALIYERVRDLPQVTAVDLYETYPGFHIDTDAEQERVRSHPILMVQHPITWYGMPPLLKLWVDEVLEHGFAYGEGGDALEGKRFQLSVTTGGPESTYTAAGAHGFPLPDLLLPYRAIARFCRMEALEPLVLHGARRVDDAYLEAHAERVRDRILSLTNPHYRGESGEF